jgi:type I restriction enzyme S subunit
MAAEWLQRPLGEVADVFDGPHATPPKTDDGPVFLGISNLARGRLIMTEIEHLSEKDYVRWTRRVRPRPGDVVFSYETRLGEAARIPPGLRCCLGRRMGLLRARPSQIDERFLLWTA